MNKVQCKCTGRHLNEEKKEKEEKRRKKTQQKRRTENHIFCAIAKVSPLRFYEHFITGGNE